jgi:hypothetical protein
VYPHHTLDTAPSFVLVSAQFVTNKEELGKKLWYQNKVGLWGSEEKMVFCTILQTNLRSYWEGVYDSRL